MSALLSFLTVFLVLGFLFTLVVMSDVKKFRELVGIVRENFFLTRSSKLLETEEPTDPFEREALAELEGSDLNHVQALQKFDEELGVDGDQRYEVEEVSAREAKRTYIKAWLKALEDKTYHGEITWEKYGDSFLSDHDQEVLLGQRGPRDIYVTRFKLEGTVFVAATIRYYLRSQRWVYHFFILGAGMSIRDAVRDGDAKRRFEHIHSMAKEGAVPKQMLEITEKLEKA